jgi:hypothetical protein
MRVKMIRSTYYSPLGRLPVNLELTVEDSIGQRWVKNSIAREVIIYENTTKQAKAAEPVVGVEEENNDLVEENNDLVEEDSKPDSEKLSSMTKAELTSIADVKGIEIPAGAKKADIIELLNNA